MKRYVLAGLVILLVAPGCASTVTKHFKVFAYPPDADITVVTGVDLKEVKYHSPANVTAELPTDPALASKATVEVSKNDYKPYILPLGSVRENQTLDVRLEKIVRHLFEYRLSYRLIAPVASKKLEFSDKTADFSFSVAEDSFQMRFANLTEGNARILWEQAQYTDVNRQPHRIMHSGIRFENRHNPLPGQTVPPRASIEESIIPIDNVYLSPENRKYGIRPLFPLYSEEAANLKGRRFSLFLPVEINGAIIPYNFKIEITGAVKQAMKQ